MQHAPQVVDSVAHLTFCFHASAFPTYFLLKQVEPVRVPIIEPERTGPNPAIDVSCLRPGP